jgi:hypothetical protein
VLKHRHLNPSKGCCLRPVQDKSRRSLFIVWAADWIGFYSLLDDAVEDDIEDDVESMW